MTHALQENARKVQKRLINKKRSPAQLAADVVEQVLVTGGEDYLETQQHALTWWQLSLLDVKLFMTGVVLSSIAILGFCFVGAVRASKVAWQALPGVTAVSKSKAN